MRGREVVPGAGGLEPPHGQHALDGRHVRLLEAAADLRPIQPPVGAHDPFDLRLALVFHRPAPAAARAGSVPAGRSKVMPYARRYPSGVGRIWSRRPITAFESPPKPARESVIVGGIRRHRGRPLSVLGEPTASSTSRGPSFSR